MREGVRGDTARDLVVSHGAEMCLRYAEALDVQEGIRNRASFLVSAIRKGYALPEPPEPTQEPLEPSLIADEAREKEPSPPSSPDPVAEVLWRRVLENIQGEIDSSSLGVWFESVTAVSLESDSLTLSVPNLFAKEYIETRFEAILEAALREELSERAALRVVVDALRQGKE
jgi:hypothetical protein